MKKTNLTMRTSLLLAMMLTGGVSIAQAEPKLNAAEDRITDQAIKADQAT